jgi:hypothetical protein
MASIRITARSAVNLKAKFFIFQTPVNPHKGRVIYASPNINIPQPRDAKFAAPETQGGKKQS